jgi:dipeptidyl aminopeptidase/acylaminoacyl peptidase
MKIALSRFPAVIASLSLLFVAHTTSCNNSESQVRGVDAVHTTTDGRELWASWLRQNADERKPALLLLHQPGAGRDRHDFDEIFDALEEAGFNLLVPDLRSHGRSDTAGSVDELETDPLGYPVDVQAWLRFLNTRFEEGDAVDPDRIGIIGLGTSANLAAAAVGHGLAHCAVAVSPDLEQFNALQAGFESEGDDDDAAGDDDDSAADDDDVADGVDLHSIRWMVATGDEPSATSATTLHAATADPSDLAEVSGSSHGVELLWESTANKTAIIEWCGANL